ncbi:MAG: putative MscS family protein YkuT [Actinomycetota bacterium]
MSNIWHDAFNIPIIAGVLINVVITILVAMFLRWILLGISNRVIRNIVDGVDKKARKLERKAERTGREIAISPRAKQRASTMGSVFKNTITWTIVTVTLIIVLQEVGVSVVAIAASAGVATAVIGFGAQNVIKDILNGLFLVFEDQFGVGDQVDLGLATGTVEEVGVRITKIRDKDGVLWFVRNGEIVRVGNLSQTKKKK